MIGESLDIGHAGPSLPDPAPIDPLQAQTHREALEKQAQTHRENIETWINFTANGLAFSIVAGFFSIIGVALLGFADITNATVAAFIGTTLGYVVGSIAPISQFYYRALPAKVEGWGLSETKSTTTTIDQEPKGPKA